MQPEDFEINLFGHEASSGGGPEKLEHLNKQYGDLVFDEVADMLLETQGKIVRALQEQTFQRVGGATRVEVACVIASSSKDLSNEMSEGRLREDLFYRLSVVPVFCAFEGDQGRYSRAYRPFQGKNGLIQWPKSKNILSAEALAACKVTIGREMSENSVTS